MLPITISTTPNYQLINKKNKTPTSMGGFSSCAFCGVVWGGSEELLATAPPSPFSSRAIQHKTLHSNKKKIRYSRDTRCIRNPHTKMKVRARGRILDTHCNRSISRTQKKRGMLGYRWMLIGGCNKCGKG